MRTVFSFRSLLRVMGSLLVFFAFPIWGDPAPANDATVGQRAYKAVLSILERNPAAPQEGDFLLVNNLFGICRDSSAPQAAKYLLESLAEDPRNDTEVRQTSVRQLYCFRDDSVHAKLMSYLADTVIAFQAATTLVQWGDWDDGAPTLAAWGGYDILARHNRAATEPLARDGVKTGRPLARLHAAYTLAQEYGDSTFLLPTARDLITKYGASAQPGEDTLLVGQILDATYSVLNDIASPNVLDLFMAGTSNRFYLIRGDAFAGLMELARNGNAMALQEIRRLEKESPYADVRERAEMGLRSLNLPQQR